MSVVTISTLGDLDNLLQAEPHNHYQLDRVHIVIINLDDASIAQLGLSRSEMVQKVRGQEYLHSVAIIFAERNGKISSLTPEVAVESIQSE